MRFSDLLHIAETGYQTRQPESHLADVDDEGDDHVGSAIYAELHATFSPSISTKEAITNAIGAMEDIRSDIEAVIDALQDELDKQGDAEAAAARLAEHAEIAAAALVADNGD